MKINIKIPIVVRKYDKVYVASSPAINVASQGKTRKQALRNIKQAVELYFEAGK